MKKYEEKRNISSVDKPLIKILLIGDINNIFVRDLTNEMKKRYNLQIDILSLFEKFDNNAIMFDSFYSLSNKKFGSDGKSKFYNLFNKFIHYFAIKDLINNLDHYDVINIHFFNPLYTYFAKELRKKAKLLCVSYWGSDFYRISSIERERQKKLIELSDVITFTNPSMEKDFLEYHQNHYRSKTKICKFGLKVLEYIDDFNLSEEYEERKNNFFKKYNIAKDKIYITCGYNSSPGQQHEAIIDEISLLDESYRKKVVFLFPMTYGDEEYRKKIEKKLLSTSLNYIIFKEFMNHEETAVLRMISDIMVNVQVSDQFSGSMQEILYAGNIVINGDWLPYNILKEKGAFYLEIENINKLNDKIIYSLDNISKIKERCKVNKEIIWELSSWENNCNYWYQIYSKVLKNQEE